MDCQRIIGKVYEKVGLIVCEALNQRLTSLIPLGRMANKEEYRAAVQFLCSEDSSYLNGQNIVMDGGRSIW